MGQNNRIEELEKEILQLEAALKNTYVYDTDTLWCRDGELYIGYNDDKMLVMNVDQLFRDLPSIISMVTKEQKKMQKMHHKMIKETLTEI
tara:strand:- start:261 stop:530 length:270 start_codon:yes stop_codon:yes gene_type:complete